MAFEQTGKFLRNMTTVQALKKKIQVRRKEKSQSFKRIGCGKKYPEYCIEDSIGGEGCRNGWIMQ